MRIAQFAVAALLASVCGATPAAAAPITFSASGATAADIQGTVDAFRTALGTLNANVPGSFDSGRREINWDGVPDIRSAPTNLPADFFNATSPRGVVFSTPGSGLQVSAGAASGTPVEFGNINPAYPGLFSTFSPPRLFTALGSNVVDIGFFVPGSGAAAATRGFGAVFTDVDLANISSISFFGAASTLLGNFFVPVDTVADGGLSFLGVDFGTPVVNRVRIVSGNAALGGSESLTTDLVVMDDFIYGEPVAVPAPSGLVVVAGLLSLGMLRRSRMPAQQNPA
jgi:hypothetical protein